MQIRRFVKSYKKFSAPVKHLDSIACDAELQEKPLAELKKLGEMLEERCKAVLNDTSEPAGYLIYLTNIPAFLINL